MPNKKNTQLYIREKKTSPEMVDFMFGKQAAYPKSEQGHFPVEDKRQVARREHTNGSTSRKDS